MAKDITYTDCKDSNGKAGDVTYRLPAGTSVSGLTRADIASLATRMTWKYKDGSSRVTAIPFRNYMS